MDDSYIEEPDPSLKKGAKWLAALLLFRVQSPVQLAAFLALNPSIKSTLKKYYRPRYKDPVTVARRLDKLLNLASVTLLYSAVAENPAVPKDYVLLYLFETYYGCLDPPSSPIVVLPSTAKIFKISSYRKSSWARWLYARKHLVIFPVIYGQILSNYLTPTRYKLNQRYFSTFVKQYMLDPVWINFRMGVRSQSINWWGLFLNYAKLNVLIAAYYAAYAFKARFWDYYTQLERPDLARVKRLAQNFAAYCLHKGNAATNLVFKPSLLAMLLLSLTAPVLRLPAIRKHYLRDMKRSVKLYIKAVGFLAGLLALATQSLSFVPAFGYTPTSEDSPEERVNVRSLSPTFYDGVNMYLLRLIVLSKWRILKENHPWFIIFKVGTWRRIESVIMCFLVWKIMNLNDYIGRHKYGPHRDHLLLLEADPIMMAVNRIMT